VSAETLHYHEQTKHHFHRYARSLGFLDWASQPNPFRLYEGVTAARLPLLQQGPAWKGFVQHGAKLVSGTAAEPIEGQMLFDLLPHHRVDESRFG